VLGGKPGPLTMHRLLAQLNGGNDQLDVGDFRACSAPAGLDVRPCSSRT